MISRCACLICKSGACNLTAGLDLHVWLHSLHAVWRVDLICMSDLHSLHAVWRVDWICISDVHVGRAGFPALPSLQCCMICSHSGTTRSSESFFRVIVSLLWHLPIVRLLWTKVMPRSFRNKYYNILYNSYNIAAFAANHWLLCQVGKTKVPTTKPAPEEIAGCKRSPKKRTSLT